MKKLLPFILMLGLVGCDGFFESTHESRQADYERKMLEQEAAKRTNGYPNVVLAAVCVRGVLYYQTFSHGSARHYVPAISSETLMPERCNEVKK